MSFWAVSGGSSYCNVFCMQHLHLCFEVMVVSGVAVAASAKMALKPDVLAKLEPRRALTDYH